MSVTEINKTTKAADVELEIRLSDIIQFLKDSLKSVLISGLLFGIIGVFYALSKPNQYSAQVTVMPEIQSKTGMASGLSPLAGLAGIDLGGISGNVDAVRPEIYPDILSSVPFALQLLKQPVYSRLSGKETSLQTFLEQQGSTSIFGLENTERSEPKEDKLLDPKNRSNVLQITKKQEALVHTVHNAVSTGYDKKTGIITVAATMPDPAVAAIIAGLSLDYLTNYITSYRTEKARNQVRFLGRQVEEAKKRYEVAEYNVSSYRDRNRNLYLNTAKIEEQRLQADFLLTQSVYNELARQFEQAKIKVSEEAPVFKVLEPARIPFTKSAPKRTLITAGFVITGFLIGLLVYAIRRFVFNSKR